MRRAGSLVGLTLMCVVGFDASSAAAAPALRIQLSQHGDMAWIGNTSAQECAAGAGAPVVGTVGNCGTETNDSAADIFWRADDPSPGQATAGTQQMAALARSTAVLKLPTGAKITYARLYWASQISTNAPDRTITLERPPTFTSEVTADDSASVLKAGTNNVYWYQSTADVTSLLKEQGPGAYRVSGIGSVEIANFDSDDPFMAWSLIVFYELASEPQRHLAIFDGLDFVNNGNPASAMLSGFLVPNAGFDAKLGVLAYEGDVSLQGDSLIFGGNSLSDTVNPTTNFFNGSRSWLGAPVSVTGDLPQMSGLAGSMSGMDLDVVNVTPYVMAGQTSATIQATSAGDTYVLGAFATSISTFQPEFITTLKSFADLSGGSVVVGDTIEYTIDTVNSGNDTAVQVVMTDKLPAGVSYVPGSIQVTSGANTGVKSDTPGDDQGEYDAATRTVKVRLGDGASGTQGGSMKPAAKTTVKFQVKVDPDADDEVSNQAIITAGGQLGNPITQYPSGNGNPDSPTTFRIVVCEGGTDCGVGPVDDSSGGDGGCGCTTPRSSSTPPALTLLFGALATAAVLRRRSHDRLSARR